MPYLLFQKQQKVFDKGAYAAQKAINLAPRYPKLSAAEITTKAVAAAESVSKMKYDDGDIIDVYADDQEPGKAVCVDGSDWDSDLLPGWRAVKVPGKVSDYLSFLAPRLSTTRTGKDGNPLEIGRRQNTFRRSLLTTQQQETLQTTRKLTLTRGQSDAARFSKKLIVGND